MRYRYAFLLLCTLATGCVAPMASIAPQRFDDQDVVYRGGIPLVLSRGDATEVVVSPRTGPTGRYTIGKRVLLQVFIRNKVAARLEVSEASFDVQVQDGTARVVRATEIEDSVLSDAAWAQAMNGFAAGVASFNAEAAGTTTFTSQSTMTGAHGQMVGTVQTTGTSYSSSAADQAHRQARADGAATSAAIRENERRQLAQVATLIQRTTIDPGESVSGLVVVEPLRRTACRHAARVENIEGRPYRSVPGGPCRMRNTVKLGGETHVFGFVEVFGAGGW